MILHLLEDEKFVDTVVEQFETVAAGKNLYFVEIKHPDGIIKYVKSRNSNIILDKSDSKIFNEITANLKTFDAVILHNLYNEYKQEVVRNASLDIYFHWMCWGADLYSIPALRKELYLPITYEYIKSSHSYFQKFINSIHNNFQNQYLLLYRFIKNKQHFDIEYPNLLKRINSVSTVIPSEYNLILKYISKEISYFPFKYGTIDSLLSGDLSTICNADNFLIGNSANETNNHLDTFEYLKELIVSDQRVYVPLSYGNIEYAKVIEIKGREIFHDSFISIKNFMPINEYNNILNSCGNVIMNQKRQQAMGNIISALWKGARIFLNEENPVFSFLKSEGIKVYTIKNIENNKMLPSFKELANHNRPLLGKLYNKTQVLSETEYLFKFLTTQTN